LGYNDLCNYDITTKFKKIFSSQKPAINSRELSIADYPSSSAVKDQGKPADGRTDTRPSVWTEHHHLVAQTVETVPETRDEHFGASGPDQAARGMSVDLAQPHAIVNTNSTIVPKEKLLTIDKDDDDIEKLQPINPWSTYFTAAQTENRQAAEATACSDNPTTSVHSQEILKILKLNEHCKDSLLRAQLERLVTQFQDRFAVNVASEPAAIPPFRIDIDTTKWSQIKPEKYPRPNL
jgi:hypothetical protein